MTSLPKEPPKHESEASIHTKRCYSDGDKVGNGEGCTLEKEEFDLLYKMFSNIYHPSYLFVITV